MYRSISQLVLPPTYSDALSPAHWRSALQHRLMLIVGGIVVDIAILWGLRGDPMIDQEILGYFAGFNISVLALLGALSLWWIYDSKRFSRHGHQWMAAAVVLEAATVIVWIYATGSLSSYFVLFGPLLIIVHRMYFGYWVGLSFGIAAAWLHLCVMVLEGTGVLVPEPLFMGQPSWVYELPMYRWMALSSILSTYLAAFVGANAMMNRLREKDRIIASVQQRIRQVEAEVQHGRCSGMVLGERFALGEVIGRGGMGEVYFGRALDHGRDSGGGERDIAVKVMHSHLLTDASLIERFYREAEAAARLPAEVTASILAVDRDRTAGVYYIAMAYLRGQDLGTYLRRRGRLPLATCMALTRDIARALDAAHAASIVHRDLKPQNIFLLEPDRAPEDRAWELDRHKTEPDRAGFEVRLLDFGLSLVLGAHATLTTASAILGTVGYFAPEQVSGRRDEIGPASDCFSLGVIVYRMLTGRLPFPARDLMAAVAEVCTAEQTPPSQLRPSLPAAVDEVMAKVLAKRAHARYASATGFADALEAALAEGVTEVRMAASEGSRLTLGDADTMPCDLPSPA